MAYPCPRCSSHDLVVEQKSGMYAGGGLVGWMLMRAFSGKYLCPSCGEVAVSELPPATRSEIMMKKAGLVVGAVVLLVVVIGVLVAIRR
ncbi:MAG: hypothetical protein H6719_23670 [Sandaracinaceae bacterium]|nr:hypothetical protein [Sandaracinaceae bacterium]